MKTTQVSSKLANALAASLCLGFATLCAGSATAENIVIPLGQQGTAWNVESPGMGTTKDQVEQKFGSPVKISGPVGDPPIYTWEYEKFRVYFEGDYVIHSVVKFQPKQDQ
jgi:hypothetical protein